MNPAQLDRIEAMLEFLLNAQRGENRVRVTPEQAKGLPAGTSHVVLQTSMLDDFNRLYAAKLRGEDAQTQG